MRYRSSQPRACTAVCREPTKLLVVPASKFTAFLEAAPAFASLFNSSAKVYTAVNNMMSTSEKLGGTIGKVHDGLPGKLGRHAVPLSNAEKRWEHLVAELLARVEGKDQQDHNKVELALANDKEQSVECLSRQDEQ